MADVFTVIGKDHEKVLGMLETLTAGTGPSSAHDKMVEQLVIDESKHEAVEEMYFWPTVREKVTGGDALAERALEQEQMAKQMLEEIEKADGSERDALIRSFAPACREHIAYEQDQVWTKLRPVLSAAEADELGDKLESAKATAPTRPHSHTPPSPTVLKGAGPAVAAADKVRDAVSGRG